MTWTRRSVLGLIVGILTMAACSSTATRARPMPGRAAEVCLRVVHIMNPQVLSLTDAPYSRGVVADVVKDPGNLMRDARVNLEIVMFGSHTYAGFLKETESLLVIDESVLRRGTCVAIRPPFRRTEECPGLDWTSRLGMDRGSAYDHLPCYEVDATDVRIEHHGCRDL